jgi:hypothetical protein
MKEMNYETNYVSAAQCLERLPFSKIDSGHGWRVADTAPISCADRSCVIC